MFLCAINAEDTILFLVSSSHYTYMSSSIYPQDMETTNSASTSLFTCPICQKSFTIRSSFGRHSRQCLERTLSRPRQKSCMRCSKRKLGCDRKYPSCSRCESEGYSCEYVTIDSNSSTESSGGGTTSTHITTPSSDLRQDGIILALPEATDQTGTNASTTKSVTGSQGSHPENQKVQGTSSPFDPALAHACRILRTYPRMLGTCDRLPPFIHRSQISSMNPPMPLVNCLALCRMWTSNSSMAAAGDFVKSSIKTEMKKLLDEYQVYDEATLVAAFQAAIIYSIILLFPAHQQPPSKMFDLSTLAALKEFSDYIRAGAMMLPEEVSHTRPSWQQWLQVWCKRRTLVCFYLFEWTNAMLNDFASFPCNAAEFIPAPVGKVLWEVTEQEKWEVAYDRWLGKWAGLNMYTLGDLESMVPGPMLDLRSDMWLEEADDLGILLLTMGNARQI